MKEGGNFAKCTTNPRQISPVVDNPTIALTLSAHSSCVFRHNFL